MGKRGRPAKVDPGQLKTLNPKDELIVAAVLVVQAKGRATVEEVLHVLEANGMTATMDDLAYVLEQMRAKKLLSETHKVRKGVRSKAYKMRDVIFAGGPELAQLAPMLPQLLETDNAKKLLSVMEGQASVGEIQKEERKPKFTDYHTIRLDLVNDQPICGGMAATTQDEQDKLLLERSNGFVVLNPLAFSNAIAAILRMGGVPESQAQYVYVRDPYIKGVKEPMWINVSIHDQRTGRGLGTRNVEAIPPGKEFSVWINYPFKGSIPLAEFIRLVNAGPLRLGAMYRRYGTTRILKYEDLGAMSAPGTCETLQKQEAEYLGHK